MVGIDPYAQPGSRLHNKPEDIRYPPANQQIVNTLDSLRDAERTLVGAVTDGGGNITGKVYLTTKFDTDGNPIGDELVAIDNTGIITRPYTGPYDFINPERSFLSDEQVTISINTTLNPPPTANHAEIEVWDGNIVWTTTGSNPDESNAVGRRSADGEHIELESADEITNFKASLLADSPTARLHVVYYFLKHHIE